MSDETAQYAVVDSPVGHIRFSVNDNGELCRVDFVSRDTRLRPPGSGRLQSAQDALLGYFDNPRSRADVRISLGGTRFQRRVWRALREIPPGQTRTYGELARRLHSSPRAIGQACKANPVSLLVPCHRVVSAGGPGGYGGAVGGSRLRIKTWLLEHERRK